jgi:hypothetical protein
MSAKNVEKSADRPRISTLTALYATNVEISRPSAGNSTLFARPPGLPLNAAVHGAGAPTRGAPGAAR